MGLITLDEIAGSWKRKKEKKSVMDNGEFNNNMTVEEYKRKYPELYAAKVKIAQEKMLRETNEVGLNNGFIDKPYTSFEEMMERSPKEFGRALTEEEKQAIFKEAESNHFPRYKDFR